MRLRSVLLAAVAAFAFASALSASAQSAQSDPFCDFCLSKCDIRYNNCISNGNDEAVCYERYMLCANGCGCG
jgi:hypothetical protein